jgi:hypothetical protein
LEVRELHAKIGQLVIERDFARYGSRQMARLLRRQGFSMGRKWIRRLMHKMDQLLHPNREFRRGPPMPVPQRSKSRLASIGIWSNPLFSPRWFL